MIHMILSAMITAFIRFDDLVVGFFKDQFFRRMHREVDYKWKKDKLEYLQERRQEWRTKRRVLIVLAIPYSLLSLLFFHSRNDDIRRITYLITSFLAYTSIILFFPLWRSVFWFRLDSLTYALISVFLWALPMRVFSACILYKIDYLARDFMSKSSDDLAIELEIEKDQIRTIHEKGEK